MFSLPQRVQKSTSQPGLIKSLREWVGVAWSVLERNSIKPFKKHVTSMYFWLNYCDRSSRPEVFCKKRVLRNFTKFTGKHLCQSLFFTKVEETPAQVFSCEFCEISKNTFSYRTSLVVASVVIKIMSKESQLP